ncbi:transcriptional regulator (IclR family) [Oceanobacillus iheyensis HTE831]|uniref:Transcriptional regulator (IclR family) n=1 Tax=Oceanobacillus iheyensis (strain DSM 14371 / CIP 107618 / JCM 11309 / KCTC 3954 / HTE831) TaxID=221109 RepID=Q8ELJ4_OCEIH|nr:IclR family transcriptional regulator [Oceanobacillus iheyensis]BAC15189.1 transcriptional regulator (IclR family) [Oceanobacillus iheyensis HTE831]
MNDSPKGIRTLQRSIDILNCFIEKNSELTLTEISLYTGLAKSTTTRLLSTLEMNNFVEKDEVNAKYRLGKQIYFLGFVAGQTFELNSLAKSTMERLREQTKETVNLYILDGKHRVCVQQFESLQSVKHMISVGQKLPLTVGASGKVFLAYQSKEFIEDAMDTQPLKKSKVDLKNELDLIIKEKYAVSIEERESGTSAAAAPIFNFQNEVVAVLSVSGPASRLKPREWPELRKMVMEASVEISKNLGYISNRAHEN